MSLMVLLFMLPVSLFAQTEPAVSPEVTNFLLSLLVAGAQKYPVLTTLIAFMGSMRAWAKPLSSLVRAVVDLTPSQADNTFLDRVLRFLHEHPVGKVLAYLLDWFASIKLTPPSKP